MDPSRAPQSSTALQVRTVFQDREFLESLGQDLEDSGKVSGFVIREVTLSHGDGYELLFCVPSDASKLASELADICSQRIRQHWHSPATVIEPAISIGPVTINEELSAYLEQAAPQSSPLRSWALGGASGAGLTLLGLFALWSSPKEEIKQISDTPIPVVWVIDPSDPTQTLHPVPDVDGVISSGPAFSVIPSDMAALDLFEESGSPQEIARAYRNALEKSIKK